MSEVPAVTEMMKLLGSVYDVEQPTDRWLSGVIQNFSAVFDRGAGAAGILYDIPAGDSFHIELHQSMNVPAGWHDAGAAAHQDAKLVSSIIAGYQSSLCTTLPQLTTNSEHLRYYRRHYCDDYGIRGQIGINGFDCSGKGCAIYLFSRVSIVLSGAQRALLNRLATYISTAYRLHRRIANGQTISSGVEAVLTPAGQIDQANGVAKTLKARQELMAAVRQRECVRDAIGKGSDVLVKSLKGLVEARWTLVDQYENGGKRYVLARENEPRPRGPARLSQRERQVVALAALGRTNKLIAYELGLAHSTVRVLMARAAVKLGTRTRSELVAKQQSAASRDGDSD